MALRTYMVQPPLLPPSTRLLTAVVLDLEDKLDARQGRIPILSVSVHL